MMETGPGELKILTLNWAVYRKIVPSVNQGLSVYRKIVPPVNQGLSVK